MLNLRQLGARDSSTGVPGSIVSEPEFASGSILGNIGAPLCFGDGGSNAGWEEEETGDTEMRNWTRDGADQGDTMVDSSSGSGMFPRSDGTVVSHSGTSRNVVLSSSSGMQS